MKQTLEKVVDDNIRFIELQFTDIFGALKSIDIPVEYLEDAIEKGVWFDGSSIRGFRRIKESDMYLKPDLLTYAILPGDNGTKKTARFFCDVYSPDGNVFEGDPRAVLKRVVNEAKQMGYDFKVGPEIEFYLFKKKEDGTIAVPEYDAGSYFDCPARDIGSNIRKEIMVALKTFGIDSERAHHEVGAGQHEIGFKYGDPVVTADKVITLKNVIKSVAHKYELTASFMPKPLFQKAGNGMHVHFSLFDKLGNPLFFDAEDKNKLSSLAKQFIAGELTHVKEICALSNPTVNSYKRLVVGYEAPIYICWGSKNRSALVRIPRYTVGRESSVRAELRCPDTSASPYLLFAAMLKIGLEGIKKGMRLMPELESTIYDKSREEIVKMDIDLLPESLDEAVGIFRKSKLMEDLLGESLFDNYACAKEKEAEEYRITVTDWEIGQYLERC